MALRTPDDLGPLRNERCRRHVGRRSSRNRPMDLRCANSGSNVQDVRDLLLRGRVQQLVGDGADYFVALVSQADEAVG